MADTFASVSAELLALSRGLTDPAEISKLEVRVLRQGVPTARSAFVADVGHDSYPEWKAPTKVVVSHAVQGARIGATGRSAGQWVVATVGRHAGQEGPVQGPIAPKLKKNGQLAKRQGRRRKWNGHTRPLGTWDDAAAVIERETPARLDREVDAVIRRTMGT